MTAELIPTVLERVPTVPWRDPYSVSPGEMAEGIRSLEAACVANPDSADLRTCLGMAYAMNYDIYKSMDALDAARGLEPRHFFSQLKYAELHFRLRALIRAEQEGLLALEYAANSWQLALARRQLHEIRTLMRSGTQKPEWTKPLASPVLCLTALLFIFSIAVYLK